MFVSNFIRRAFRRIGLLLLFISILLFLFGALGGTLGLDRSLGLILIGLGFGTFASWITWSSIGQGAPTFTKFRVFNFTGKPVDVAKTERSDPPMPASPPPPPPPELRDIPPHQHDKIKADPGIPFRTGVKALRATIRIEGVDYSFDHPIPPPHYAADRVMFQDIVVAEGAAPGTYQALSILYHLSDTDEPWVRESEYEFPLT